MPQQAKFDTLRSIDAATITGAYQAFGAPLSHITRIVTITNNTQGDMLITTDNSEDQLIVIAGSFKLYDIQSDRNAKDDQYAIAIGTQFYIKQSTAPVSGHVYIEAIY